MSIIYGQITQEAKAIFHKLPALNHVPETMNADQLHKELSADVTFFNTKIGRLKLTEVDQTYACFILCAFIDESLLNTTWGKEAHWHKKTLTSVFYRNTIGGDKIFSILSKIKENPSSHVQLLEFIYICLSLGFSGKYRIEKNGKQELALIRRELHLLLQEHSEKYSLVEMPLLPVCSKKKFVRNWTKPLFLISIILMLIFYSLGEAHYVKQFKNVTHHALIAGDSNEQSN